MRLHGPVQCFCGGLLSGESGDRMSIDEPPSKVCLRAWDVSSIARPNTFLWVLYHRLPCKAILAPFIHRCREPAPCFAVVVFSRDLHILSSTINRSGTRKSPGLPGQGAKGTGRASFSTQPNGPINQALRGLWRLVTISTRVATPIMPPVR